MLLIFCFLFVGSTSKSKPMETKPIKHDNVPIWRSVVANPQKRITELEGKVNQLEIDLAKVRYLRPGRRNYG